VAQQGKQLELHTMRDSPRAISMKAKRRLMAMSIRAIVRSAVFDGGPDRWNAGTRSVPPIEVRE
jgi:hypothetical protein